MEPLALQKLVLRRRKWKFFNFPLASQVEQKKHLNRLFFPIENCLFISYSLSVSNVDVRYSELADNCESVDCRLELVAAIANC